MGQIVVLFSEYDRSYLAEAEIENLFVTSSSPEFFEYIKC